MTRRGWVLAAVGGGISGCGYKLAGTADTIPKNVQRIAVTPFVNVNTRYRLADKLSNYLVRELLSRTRYEVVPAEAEADAILSGGVNSVITFPTSFDPATGRAAAVEIIVLLNVTLRERVSAKVLYTTPNLTFRQRYEISIDPAQYLDESSLAFDRLATDVARTVVSAVLENF